MTSSPSSSGSVSLGEDSGDKFLGIVDLSRMKQSLPSKHTAEETYLFHDHPPLFLNLLLFHLEHLEPCLRNETEHYLIYTTLPDVSVENQIVDGDGGIWEATILPQAITEYGRGIGKRQVFRYKQSHCNTSSWRMVMYNLDFGDKSDHVICKVFEALDSETAKAVRAAAEGEAKKIKFWEVRAAAKAEAKTSKKMIATFEKKFKDLMTEAEENATKLVTVREEVAHKGLIELR